MKKLLLSIFIIIFMIGFSVDAMAWGSSWGKQIQEEIDKMTDSWNQAVNDLWDGVESTANTLGQEYDKSAGKFVSVCDDNESWSVPLQRCHEKCESETIWSDTLEECSPSCESDEEWSDELYLCHPKCEEGEELNEDSTECIPICDEGYSWSYDYEKCLPGCEEGKSWDEYNEVCRAPCEIGDYWNPTVDTCVGEYECFKWQIANKKTWTCEDEKGLANSDEDYIPDRFDNCPGVANEDQADADLDGVGDACDEENNPPQYSGAYDPIVSASDDGGCTLIHGTTSNFGSIFILLSTLLLAIRRKF